MAIGSLKMHKEAFSRQLGGLRASCCARVTAMIQTWGAIKGKNKQYLGFRPLGLGILRLSMEAKTRTRNDPKNIRGPFIRTLCNPLKDPKRLGSSTSSIGSPYFLQTCS